MVTIPKPTAKPPPIDPRAQLLASLSPARLAALRAPTDVPARSKSRHGQRPNTVPLSRFGKPM